MLNAAPCTAFQLLFKSMQTALDDAWNDPPVKNKRTCDGVAIYSVCDVQTRSATRDISMLKTIIVSI